MIDTQYKKVSRSLATAIAILMMTSCNSLAGNAVAIEIIKITHEGIELDGSQIKGGERVKLNGHRLAHVVQQNQSDLQFIHQRAFDKLAVQIAAELKTNPGKSFVVCNETLCIYGRAAK